MEEHLTAAHGSCWTIYPPGTGTAATGRLMYNTPHGVGVSEVEEAIDVSLGDLVGIFRDPLFLQCLSTHKNHSAKPAYKLQWRTWLLLELDPQRTLSMSTIK